MVSFYVWAIWVSWWPDPSSSPLTVYPAAVTAHATAGVDPLLGPAGGSAAWTARHPAADAAASPSSPSGSRLRGAPSSICSPAPLASSNYRSLLLKSSLITRKIIKLKLKKKKLRKRVWWCNYLCIINYDSLS